MFDKNDVSKSAKYIKNIGYGTKCNEIGASIKPEDYFITVRDAVIREYTGLGFCELVDEYLYRKQKRIDAVTLAAIAQISSSVKYEKHNSQLIPYEYEEKKFKWDDLEKTSVEAEVSDNILEILEQANKFGRKLHIDHIKSLRNCSQGENIAEDSLKKHLYEYHQSYRNSSERKITSLINDGQKNLSKTEEFHDKMCAKTNELQASWIKALSKLSDEMTSQKEEFYKHLHNWQKGLYPHEFEQLAERYTELYRIIDIDKLIIEIITNINSQHDLNEGIGMPETVARLEKLDKALHIFLHKFEVSLGGLGLYVYRAEEGAQFDYIWHTNVDDSVDCNGKCIKKCIVPGIARRSADDGEDDVIIPALVSI